MSTSFANLPCTMHKVRGPMTIEMPEPDAAALQVLTLFVPCRATQCTFCNHKVPVGSDPLSHGLASG